MLDWIKLKKRIIIIFLLIILLILFPIFIHIVFKIPAINEFWVAEWSIGDFLGFYGAVLSFIGTVTLGVLALYQNNLFKKQNERIMQLQNVPYFSYANLIPGNLFAPTEEQLNKFENIILASQSMKDILGTIFTVENISDYPIYYITAKIQGYDRMRRRWCNIIDENCIIERRFHILPKKRVDLFIGFDNSNIIWTTLKMVGFSPDKIGIKLEFTNTNTLSTYGRIVIDRKTRKCKYQLLPLELESLMEESEE